MPPHADRPDLRTDIQGLRAIAVATVVTFHIWPSALSGGYVGVDVFFVISGFLITAHLLGRPPVGVRDLVSFWARRIRRLLPASLLVLFATLIATRVLAPETQWDATGRMARAAALYVVNWSLAAASVDYLAAEDAATPVQHFWSLSVEEQFYFVWPVLLLALVLAARLARRRLGWFALAGLSAVFAGSLAWSVHATATDPAAAYFVSPTRVWELAVGGMLAAWYARHAIDANRHPDPDPTTVLRRPLDHPLAVEALCALGLAAIAYACVAFDERTPFPGLAALVPVLGAAAVMASRASVRSGPVGWFLALPPMQWLGGISYSVYLWHWPLVVLLPYASGGSLGRVDKVAIVVATVVLAQLTKTLVEDPVRFARPDSKLRWTFAAAAAGMAVVVVAAGLSVGVIDQTTEPVAQRVARLQTERAGCFGAAALDPGAQCEPESYGGLALPPAQALKDLPKVYPNAVGGKDCQARPPAFESVTCVFGVPDASTTVYLVGNSHAGQWLPALEALALKKHWRVETHISSGCVLAETRQTFDTKEKTENCLAWARRTVQDVITGKPDLVVMSHRMTWAAEGKTLETSLADYEAGTRPTLKAWQEAGINLLILRDTPAPHVSAPKCVAEHTDDITACDGPRDEWLPDDPFLRPAAELKAPLQRVADLNDHICPRQTCPISIGGVIVYFDGWHLSATFATTLAPYLERAIGPL